MHLLKTVCCAAALVTCLAPGARADEWNKKTILTFSGPVQIPGATLAAGSYVFKLADLTGNRHVVQIFDKDEKKIYGTILAIPDQRLEPADEPVVLFSERTAGTPQAIRAWFYPGDTYGNEFVYPKTQAVKIAKSTHQSVLAMDEDAKSTTDEERMNSMKSASVNRVDESGQTSAVTAENQNRTTTTTGSTTASTTTGTSTTTSDDAKLKNSSGRTARMRGDNTAVGTSGQQPANADNAQRNAPRSLPRTASDLALFELVSGLSVAGALGVRRIRLAFNR